MVTRAQRREGFEDPKEKEDPREYREVSEEDVQQRMAEAEEAQEAEVQPTPEERKPAASAKQDEEE